MHNHTGCICLSFLHCAFSNVSSSCLPEMMQNHTGCICLTFLHCVFSNVSSKNLNQSMHNHTGCICLSFLHCVFSNASSNRLRYMMHTHSSCICLIFLCPLSLSLKRDWLCFYYNLLAQNFDPFKKCAVSCNSCFQLKAHWFSIVGTEIESESHNKFSRLRKFGPPKKILCYMGYFETYIPQIIFFMYGGILSLTYSHLYHY